MNITLVTRYFDFKNAGIGRISSEMLKGLLNNNHQVNPISTNSQSLHGYLYYSLLQLKYMLPKASDVYHAITPIEGIYLPSNKSMLTILDLIPMAYPDRCGAGIGYNRLKNFIGTEYFSFCSNKSARKARVITTISEMSKGHIIDYLNIKPEDVYVIKPGISPEFKPETIYKKDKNKGLTIYGYLGQLDRRKRVDLLINAFKEKASSKSLLIIVGTGRDENLLKCMAGNDKRIEFVGFINDDQLKHFYNYLDYFIFPSWAEGYGLPIVESLACGTPVITLEDAAIPKEVKNKTTIVSDLRDFFADMNRYNMAPYLSDSYVNWAGSHSWDNYVKEHIELYSMIGD